MPATLEAPTGKVSTVLSGKEGFSIEVVLGENNSYPNNNSRKITGSGEALNVGEAGAPAKAVGHITFTGEFNGGELYLGKMTDLDHTRIATLCSSESCPKSNHASITFENATLKGVTFDLDKSAADVTTIGENVTFENVSFPHIGNIINMPGLKAKHLVEANLTPENMQFIAQHMLEHHFERLFNKPQKRQKKLEQLSQSNFSDLNDQEELIKLLSSKQLQDTTLNSHFTGAKEETAGAKEETLEATTKSTIVGNFGGNDELYLQSNTATDQQVISTASTVDKFPKEAVGPFTQSVISGAGTEEIKR